MPMKSASLLSQEQLDTVFSNLEELITIADRFADDLLDALELSTEHGDEVGRTYDLRSTVVYSLSQAFVISERKLQCLSISMLPI